MLDDDFNKPSIPSKLQKELHERPEKLFLKVFLRILF